MIALDAALAAVTAVFGTATGWSIATRRERACAHAAADAAEARVSAAAERRYTLLEAIPDGVYIIDPADRVTHMNEEAERLLGVEPGTSVGASIEATLDPLGSDLLPEIRRARASGEIVARTAFFPATGWWIEIRIKPADDETIVYLRDVTVRKSADAKLEASDHRLRMLMSQVPALLWSVDRQGRFHSISGAGVTALAISEADLLHQSCMLLLGFDQAADALASAFDGGATQFESPFRGRWLRHHVEPLRDAEERIIGAVGVSIDISEIKETQLELEAAAERDALTGLPNRLALERALGDSLAVPSRRRADLMLAVLFIDIDRFKTINDTLGHRVGDDVLRIVAERLRMTVASDDVIARPGGDEFMVVLRSIASATEAADVSARILRRFAEPIGVEGRQFVVSASIGVALAPAHGTSAGELIKNADAAMYRAKGSGRAAYAFYDPLMEATALERLTIENDLRGAIVRDELKLLYQPIVDIGTGRILGCEALLRWPHPRLGELPPAAFIGLAEESGLIVDITRWVLKTGCAFGASMRRTFPHFRIAINLSARDLREPDVVAAICDEVERSQLDPAAIDLEVTESVVLDEASIAALAQLRACGFGIAIDDFGIAYSALSYLTRLPISAIKIDRSFIAEVAGNRFHQAIVKTIVTLGMSLDLRVIAEGIETEAQSDFVAALGCSEAQGFRYSPAIAGDTLRGMVAPPPETLRTA
jgi:diguanylate cyclase (GGDEF)-like protein